MFVSHAIVGDVEIPYKMFKYSSQKCVRIVSNMFLFKFQKASQYTFKHTEHSVDIFRSSEIEIQVFTPKTIDYNTRTLELKQNCLNFLSTKVSHPKESLASCIYDHHVDTVRGKELQIQPSYW